MSVSTAQPSESTIHVHAVVVWSLSRVWLLDCSNPMDWSLPGSSAHGIHVHTSPLFKILPSVKWNALCCVLSQWTSLFQTRSSEPRWSAASYLDVTSYFLPSRCRGAGGRWGSCHHIHVSHGKQGVSTWAKRKRDWPQIARWGGKKWFQQAWMLASSQM